MLIAANIAKRQSANASTRDALKVKRAAAAAEDLDGVSPGPDEKHGTVSHKYFVFVDAGSHKDLVEFPGFLQRRARPRIR